MISFKTIVDKIKSASSNSSVVTSSPKIGRMCCFMYNPKTKEKLPYYDIFPLVIPVDRAPGGFFGINFHYLDTRNRNLLLNIILPMNDVNNDMKKIQISYTRLKGLSSTLWKPCFKRYLYSHIRTKIIDIPVPDWKDVIKLPVMGFTKANASDVYKMSRKIIK